MGHERAQAGAEGDGGHHHRDGEDGAEDGRTDRDGAAAGAGLEGETDAGHSRRRQTRTGCCRGDA